MRYWISALLALSVATPGAGQDRNPKQKSPVSSLLPEGSQLHGVVIPRHNERYQLVNSLMADVVTLVNDEIIAGEHVTIDFYDNLGSRNARIKLHQATFSQTAGMLHASETVTLDADRCKARGTGLHYAIQSGRGFLNGPAITWMHEPSPKTTMKSKTPSIIGAAGVALIAQTAATTEAQSRTAPPDGPVKVNTVAQNPISEARAEAQEQLEKAIESSSTTDAEVRDFIENTPLDYENITGNKATTPPAEALKFEPGPDHTVVNCDGGMYFDSDKGLLVYLKNVRVKDPQYTLTGADVLRIYMAQKTEAKPQKKSGEKKETAKPGKQPEQSGSSAQTDGEAAQRKAPVPAIGGNFESVEKIVASGAVRILQKTVEKGKQPVEASGALFTYHPKTGDILLSGGYPWVKQGDFFARAKEPNLTLRMKKDGSFVTEGNWEMGGRLNQKNQGKQKPKPGKRTPQPAGN